MSARDERLYAAALLAAMVVGLGLCVGLVVVNSDTPTRPPARVRVWEQPLPPAPVEPAPGLWCDPDAACSRNGKVVRGSARDLPVQVTITVPTTGPRRATLDSTPTRAN